MEEQIDWEAQQTGTTRYSLSPQEILPEHPAWDALPDPLESMLNPYPTPGSSSSLPEGTETNPSSHPISSADSATPRESHIYSTAAGVFSELNQLTEAISSSSEDAKSSWQVQAHSAIASLTAHIKELVGIAVEDALDLPRSSTLLEEILNLSGQLDDSLTDQQFWTQDDGFKSRHMEAMAKIFRTFATGQTDTNNVTGVGVHGYSKRRRAEKPQSPAAHKTVRALRKIQPAASARSQSAPRSSPALCPRCRSSGHDRTRCPRLAASIGEALEAAGQVPIEERPRRSASEIHSSRPRGPRLASRGMLTSHSERDRQPHHLSSTYRDIRPPDSQSFVPGSTMPMTRIGSFEGVTATLSVPSAIRPPLWIDVTHSRPWLEPLRENAYRLKAHSDSLYQHIQSTLAFTSPHSFDALKSVANVSHSTESMAASATGQGQTILDFHEVEDSEIALKSGVGLMLNTVKQAMMNASPDAQQLTQNLLTAVTAQHELIESCVASFRDAVRWGSRLSQETTDSM